MKGRADGAERARRRQAAIDAYVRTGDILVAIRESGLRRAVIYAILDEAGIRPRLRRAASPAHQARKAARRREIAAIAAVTGLGRAAAALTPDDWRRGWPDSMVDQAVALSAAGLSAAEIAGLLSAATRRTITRSAVLGILLRARSLRT